MTVWSVWSNYIKHERTLLGLFTTEALATQSISFSFHKRHVRIESEWSSTTRELTVRVFENDEEIDTLLVKEEPVHSSVSHL
jgi:hypothetical protein